ncbi:MAG: glycosyltransferase family 4 protein [Ignavibacteria bacterium]|nr:glycosyltransferase family 4 protein [Ignavibacteria bacterium]
MSKQQEKKILILVPGKNARGGITNYYYSIKSEFTKPIEYFLRGSRMYPVRHSLLRDISRPLKDFYLFWKKIRKKEYSLLQTSTGFDGVSIIRDVAFIVLAKMYKMKVIIFFRGWDLSMAEKIEKNYLSFFKLVYFKADAIIELSSEFKKRLHDWGYKKKIYLETTLVNKELVEDLSEEMVVEKFRRMKTIEILFLARIEKAKGIYQSIDAFTMLQKKYSNVHLTIAGDGTESENVKSYVKEKDIKDITFLDHISGEQKKECYRKGHIYLFPSYWHEGMPNSVLEALAFGIPVVTRKVGGLIDFFENGVHGHFTDSKEPEVFFKFMDSLLSDMAQMETIAVHNFGFAKEKFLSPNVAKRIEKIFDEVLAD